MCKNMSEEYRRVTGAMVWAIAHATWRDAESVMRIITGSQSPLYADGDKSIPKEMTPFSVRNAFSEYCDRSKTYLCMVLSDV